LRNQFNLFYRFGYTFVPGSQLVEFDGNINEEVKKRIIEQFRTIAPFEYDEEYLILHLEKTTDGQSGAVRFDISDIVAIYPLSQQAKMSIESKIDQRIRLEEPVFEGVLPEIETKIEKKEVEKGISALWAICKIDGSWEEHLANIGLENIRKGLSHRKNGTKAYKIEEGGNYWEHLLAYDRHDYFPTSTLGYFYDAGQVYAYSRGFSTFKGSDLHDFLEGLNADRPNIKTEEIVKLLEREDQPKSYVSKTTVSGIKQYVVAPLFLMIREEIRKANGSALPKLLEKLPHLDKTFGDSFRYAAVLLGAFFGFRTFYDPYYEVLNLRFHKNRKASKEQAEANPKIGETVNTVIEEREKQTDKERPEIKDEEKVAETTVVEKQNLDIKLDKQTSESLNQKIIRKAVDEQKEVKLADIAETIKKKGRKILIKELKEEAERMDGIEIYKL